MQLAGCMLEKSAARAPWQATWEACSPQNCQLLFYFCQNSLAALPQHMALTQPASARAARAASCTLAKPAKGRGGSSAAPDALPTHTAAHVAASSKSAGFPKSHIVLSLKHADMKATCLIEGRRVAASAAAALRQVQRQLLLAGELARCCALPLWPTLPARIASKERVPSPLSPSPPTPAVPARGC